MTPAISINGFSKTNVRTSATIPAATASATLIRNLTVSASFLS